MNCFYWCMGAEICMFTAPASPKSAPEKTWIFGNAYKTR